MQDFSICLSWLSFRHGVLFDTYARNVIQEHGDLTFLRSYLMLFPVIMWHHQFLWVSSKDTECNYFPPAWGKGLNLRLYKALSKMPITANTPVEAVVLVLAASVLVLSWCSLVGASTALPKQ